MKNVTPRQLALYFAGIFTAVMIAVLMILDQIKTFNKVITIVLCALFVFFFIYFIVQHFINRLIAERINPIYKTIHNVNISGKDLKKSVEKLDVFSEVKTDVINWAQKRKNEIAELKQNEKYRKEFLGNVMHELKTPIFNIQGYVLTLLDGGLEDPTVNRPYLERTEKSINRLISIVEDLESISRLEAGELQLEMQTFDIRKLFDESFEIHEMLAKQMKINLKFDKPYDKPINVYADRNRILEAVNNLIVNSIKYGKMKGCTTVSFHDMNENILVEISDDGIGIEETKIQRVFERFYRVDKGRSREQGGTGLGLSIVKHIIEAHKQSMHVRSKINHGSTFSFTIQKALNKPGKSNSSIFLGFI